MPTGVSLSPVMRFVAAVGFAGGIGCTPLEAPEIGPRPEDVRTVDARFDGATTDADDADAGRDGDLPNPPRIDVDAMADADTGVCGDGVVEVDEECEPGDLSTTCFDLGFGGGQLACSPETCTFETFGCYECDYFFAPETGDTTPTAGRTAENPARTAEQLRAALRDDDLVAGTRICLRRGETLTVVGGIEISRSGSPGEPVVVTSYGDPTKPPPKLTASIELHAGGWTEASPNGILSRPLPVAGAGGRVWHTWQGDNQYDADDQASDETLQDGSYFWNGSTFFYRANPAGTDTSVIDESVYVAMAPTILRLPPTTTVHDVTVSDLSFERGASAVTVHGSPGIAGPGGPAVTTGDIVIADSEFSRFRAAVQVALDGGGVVGLDVRRNTFAKTSLGVAGGAGDEFSTLRDLYVARNDFQTSFPGARAVYLEETTDGTFYYNVFRHSVDDAGGSRGIMLNAVEPADVIVGNRIARNVVSGYGVGVLLTSVAGAEIGVSNNTVQQNILTENGVHIEFEGCDQTGNTRFHQNTMVGAEVVSLRMPVDCGVQTLNNLSVISEFGTHVRMEDPPGLTSVPNFFDHNAYVPGQSAHWVVQGEILNWADWQSGGHDVSAVISPEPGFVAADPVEASDYIPAANSVVLDVGTDLGITTDFGGRRRIEGEAVDIGAWERHPRDP